MTDSQYMKNWKKVLLNEHQVTTNVLENDYKEFIKKLDFDPKYVKVDKYSDSEGGNETAEIFLKIDGSWEPIGVIHFDANGKIVRDGESWFNIEGLEDTIEEYSKMISEESAMGAGGVSGASATLPGLDNSYGYWGIKKKKEKFEAQRHKREKGEKFDTMKKIKGLVGDVYVLFHKSELNKVGINPKSKYGTPIGIYTYPLTERIYSQLVDGALPFKGESTFTHFLKVREEYRKNIPVVSARGHQIAGDPVSEDVVKEVFYEHLGYDDARYERMVSEVREDGNGHPVDFVWRAMMYISRKINPDKASAMWAKLMTSVGIYGVIDLGSGTVHPNEPEQAVVFSKEVVEQIHTEEVSAHIPRNVEGLDVNKALMLPSMYIKKFAYSDDGTLFMEKAFAGGWRTMDAMKYDAALAKEMCDKIIQSDRFVMKIIIMNARNNLMTVPGFDSNYLLDTVISTFILYYVIHSADVGFLNKFVEEMASKEWASGGTNKLLMVRLLVRFLGDRMPKDIEDQLSSLDDNYKDFINSQREKRANK